MPVAFAITRSEEEVARKVFTDESPALDGNLFRFRGVDVKPALDALLSFANDAEDSDEGNAALRLSGRLATWLGRNTVKPEPLTLDQHLEAGKELLDPNVLQAIDTEAPSPAPRSKRGRKGASEGEKSPVETDTSDE